MGNYLRRHFEVVISSVTGPIFPSGGGGGGGGMCEKKLSYQNLCGALLKWPTKI